MEFLFVKKSSKDFLFPIGFVWDFRFFYTPPYPKISTSKVGSREH